MKKFAISFLAFLGITASAFGESKVNISGKVEFINPDFRMVVFRPAGFGRDTLAQAFVNPETHEYSLDVDVKTPGVAYLDCGRTQNLRFWLEDENLKINFRGVDTAKIKIKNPPFTYIQGGKNNDVMNLVNFTNFRSYQTMIAISQAASKAKFADDSSKTQLTKTLYDADNDNSKDYLRLYARQYAGVNSVVAVLQGLDKAKDSVLISETLKTLSAREPVSKAVADAFLKEEADKKAAKEGMEPGKPAPKIVAFTAKGKKISPADFKGKVLVLDFWASWCGPCRAENPKLKEAYERFKGKDVEFLSISIDDSRDAWLKAEKDDKCPWPQGIVNDEGKEAMLKYQFSGIPFILVVDKRGNIYRKHLRGKNVAKAIEDCLNGVPAE